MIFRLGLTGSIGMGKSATAQLFVQEGCVLWDADAAVHRLYGPQGAAVAPIADLFPEVIEKNSVSRDALRQLIAKDSTALPRIEALVHPLVRADREAFAAAHPGQIGVFDIPLLFETGAEAEMDATVVVWIDAAEQRRRVLARGSMTEADLDRILARQMPSDDKRARAAYQVQTDTPEHAQAQVRAVMRAIRERLPDA